MTGFMDAGTIRRLCLALALLVLLPLPALAATIFVDDDCTLAEAITSANDDDAPVDSDCEDGDGGDTIVLARNVDSTEADTSSLTIESEIFIEGRRRAIVGIGNTGITFSVSAGAGNSLTIDNAHFTNGRLAGAFDVVPFTFSGNVTLQNVELYSSAGDSETTGVRLVGGSGVKIRESVFKDNRLNGGSVVSGAVDIFRSAIYNNRVDDTGNIISGATIRSSTIGLNRSTFAVSGGDLRNVTVAYNRGGGVMVAGDTRIRNSIMYGNSGSDCEGPGGLNGINWVGQVAENGTPCSGGERTYTGPSPDIEDEDDWIFGLFPLDADGDAVGVGRVCEFLDQWGRPFGPTGATADSCDLGAHSTYDPGSGPRISVPVPTPLPSPTPVPGQPAPTPVPVQGWVLFSDRDDIRSNEVNAAGVGIAHIVEMGFLTALDIWSEVGWGVTACHTDYSNGNFVFLDAAGMPREAVTWPAAPHIDGMACTYIETPGTIVLLRADPWQEPPSPTPDPNAPVFGPVPLEDCELITRDMVNLRAEVWGDVLNIIPFETELIATESEEEFFKVTFEEQEGWVHRDWVTITGGDCGEDDEEEE